MFIGTIDAETESPILCPPNLKSQLIGKVPMLGKIEGKRRRWQQCIRWLDSVINPTDMNLSNSGRYWRAQKHRVLFPMMSQTVQHDLATEQQKKRFSFFPPSLIILCGIQVSHCYIYMLKINEQTFGYHI